MKALTVHAPWAWLIVHGHKRIENRAWPPSMKPGERFAIHQGKSYDREGEVLASSRGVEGPAEFQMENRKILGAVLGVATFAGVVDNPDDLFPDLDQVAWWRGPLGLKLEDAVAINRPIPCRGMQKLWTLPANVEAELLAQLDEVRPKR